MFPKLFNKFPVAFDFILRPKLTFFLGGRQRQKEKKEKKSEKSIISSEDTKERAELLLAIVREKRILCWVIKVL